MMAGSLVALCGAVVGATGQSINQMIASGVLFGVGGGLQGVDSKLATMLPVGLTRSQRCPMPVFRRFVAKVT